ncbi:MAG: hypothetical protein ACLPUO_21480 [Streptosporangiaceae bacterium]
MTTLDKFASGEGEVRISLAAVRHCDLAGLSAPAPSTPGLALG